MTKLHRITGWLLQSAMLLWVITVVMFFTGDPGHLPRVAWYALATSIVGLGAKALDNQDQRQRALEAQQQPRLQ